MEANNWIQWMQDRSSVRTFENRDIEVDTIDQLIQVIDEVNRVLSEKAYFKLIQSSTKRNETQKLGTYGIIQGTRNFIAVITTQEEVDACELGVSNRKSGLTCDRTWHRNLLVGWNL